MEFFIGKERIVHVHLCIVVNFVRLCNTKFTTKGVVLYYRKTFLPLVVVHLYSIYHYISLVIFTIYIYITGFFIVILGFQLRFSLM